MVVTSDLVPKSLFVSNIIVQDRRQNQNSAAQKIDTSPHINGHPDFIGLPAGMYTAGPAKKFQYARGIL